MRTKWLTIAAFVGLICQSVPLRAADPFKATPLELNAKDLADVLGLRWWKYDLGFNQPASAVNVRLYELTRRPDGSWRREPLSVNLGYERTDGKIKQATVTVVVPDGKAPRVSLQVEGGGGYLPTINQKVPDFQKMAWSPKNAQVVSGCIALAVEYKNQTATGREEDMVRVFGLEVRTK